MLSFFEKSEKSPYHKIFVKKWIATYINRLGMFFILFSIYMKEYECKKCNYKTVRKYNFDKHLRSNNHNKDIDSLNSNVDTNNGVKNELKNNNMVYATNDLKNDQNLVAFYCERCNYTCYYKSNYNRHIMTSKHILLQSCDVKKIYDCSICGFESSKKSNYMIHLKSNKHIQNAIIHDNKIHDNKIHDNKIHDNKIHDNNKITINDDAISSIMTEIKCLMVEQNKMNKIITEIANKPTNNIIQHNNQINNQTNNQQFNLNVFLNETCKDAMNLSDFLENMHVSMEDMEKTGELGFAKGMSRIIMNNLNAIDVCKRPIHCSDVKRETLYVKNNGVWEKETDERKRTKEIIYKVSCLNERQLIKWRDLPRNKGYDKSDHKKNDEFTKLVMEINKLREEEINKVITAVSKGVVIDKDKIKMSGYLN
jgi:hypothetical protein